MSARACRRQRINSAIDDNPKTCSGRSIATRSDPDFVCLAGWSLLSVSFRSDLWRSPTAWTSPTRARSIRSTCARNVKSWATTAAACNKRTAFSPPVAPSSIPPPILTPPPLPPPLFQPPARTDYLSFEATASTGGFAGVGLSGLPHLGVRWLRVYRDAPSTSQPSETCGNVMTV